MTAASFLWEDQVDGGAIVRRESVVGKNDLNTGQRLTPRRILLSSAALLNA
jgi:hypothetical protein